MCAPPWHTLVTTHSHTYIRFTLVTESQRSEPPAHSHTHDTVPGTRGTTAISVGHTHTAKYKSRHSTIISHRRVRLHLARQQRGLTLTRWLARRRIGGRRSGRQAEGGCDPGRTCRGGAGGHGACSQVLRRGVRRGPWGGSGRQSNVGPAQRSPPANKAPLVSGGGGGRGGLLPRLLLVCVCVGGVAPDWTAGRERAGASPAAGTSRPAAASRTAAAPSPATRRRELMRRRARAPRRRLACHRTCLRACAAC